MDYLPARHLREMLTTVSKNTTWHCSNFTAVKVHAPSTARSELHGTLLLSRITVKVTKSSILPPGKTGSSRDSERYLLARLVGEE